MKYGKAPKAPRAPRPSEQLNARGHFTAHAKQGANLLSPDAFHGLDHGGAHDHSSSRKAGE